MNVILTEGFEADWEPGELENPSDPNSYPGHKAIRMEMEGTHYVEYNGSIFNPPGWICFYRHGLPVAHDSHNVVGWSAPEVRHSTATDPNRFRSGQRGQLLFTFSRIHDAGFVRPIQVQAGQTVQISAWAHAWSNNWDTLHTDDPAWSEGAGHSAMAIPEGSADNDELKNFTFYVGIDPTGGLNPDSPDVMWSQGEHVYNEFAEIGPVSAVAQADIVTVFLRSVCLWPYKHNDAYWDDVQVAVSETTIPPDPDPGPVEADYGSDIGIHYLTTGQVLNFQEKLMGYGARFKVIKAVSDWGALKEAKRRDPDVITIGRIHSDKEGVGEANDPNADLFAVAQALVDLVLAEIEQDPELRSLVDYWEICNEPLGGGCSTASYVRLAWVMCHAMELAEQHSLKLGLFAFNAGTPEWDDMVAMAAIGVFGMAKQGGHILTLHEGSLGGPIDEGMGDVIPGAPVVDGAGSLCFRFRYLYRILGQRDEIIPLVVSEWYPGADRDDIPATLADYMWYDMLARTEPYFWSFTPFTCGAAYGWEFKDQEPFYSVVMEYMRDVKADLNWSSEPEPGPDPGPGRGAPREQYNRTYVLLPPGMGLAWSDAALSATWEDQRWTVGGSADDAGIGDLDIRQVIAVNPDEWGASDDGRGLLGFYERFYPGVEARMVSAVDPDDLFNQLSGRTFEDLSALTPYPAEAGPIPDDIGGLVSAHFQTPIDGWEQFIADAQPPAVVVFWAEAARRIKELSPHTIVLWRFWVDDSEQDRLLYLPDSNAAASEYLARFRDTLVANSQWIDYASSLNERYSWDNERTRRAALFDAAFAQELHRLQIKTRAGILAGPVGYPNLSQVELIRPAVEAAYAYSSVVLYHGYYMMHNGTSLLIQRWEQDAGLFLDVLDPIFVRWGYKLRYLQGETGPVGSYDGAAWEPQQGWRSDLCYGGDQDAFLNGLAALQGRWTAWNAVNECRFLGGVLFTSGEGIGWDSYLIRKRQLEALTARFYSSE